MIRIGVIDALKSLAPGATWEYNFDTETLTWMSDDIDKPSKQEIENEISRLIEIAQNEEDEKASAEAAVNAAKQSALAKLSLLGLTEEEAKAVIGIE